VSQNSSPKAKRVSRKAKEPKIPEREEIKFPRASNEVFLAAFFPPMERIKAAKEPIYTNLIVYGQQGFGKTEFVKWLCQKASDFYGRQRVNAVASTSIGALLDEGMNRRPIQILVAEDLTLRPVSKFELKEFYRIRHIAMDEVGLKKGYIISVLTLHDLFSAPKHLRTFAPFIVACNAPTNRYDYNILKAYLSEDIIKRLEEIQKLKHFYDEAKAYKAYWFLGYSGFLKTDLVNFKLRQIGAFEELPEIKAHMAEWEKLALGARPEAKKKPPIEEEEEGMEHYADEYDEFY